MNKEIKRLIDKYEERIKVLQSGFLINANSELLTLEAIIDDLKALQPSPLPESVEEDNVQWNATDEEMDLLTISLNNSAEVERLRQGLTKLLLDMKSSKAMADQVVQLNPAYSSKPSLAISNVLSLLIEKIEALSPELK